MIRQAGRAADLAADALVAAASGLADGTFSDERNANAAFVQAARDRFDGREGPRGLRWRARTLSDMVRNSEESRFGADVAIVVQAIEPDITVTKGMLLQMKRSDRLQAEWTNLRDSCRLMVRHTPAAFAVVYDHPQDSWTHPAVDLVGWTPSRFPLPPRQRPRARHLFYEFFRCYVGDPRVPELLFDGRQIAADRALLIQLAPRENTAALEWLNQPRAGYSGELAPEEVVRLTEGDRG